MALNSYEYFISPITSKSTKSWPDRLFLQFFWHTRTWSRFPKLTKQAKDEGLNPAVLTHWLGLATAWSGFPSLYTQSNTLCTQLHQPTNDLLIVQIHCGLEDSPKSKASPSLSLHHYLPPLSLCLFVSTGPTGSVVGVKSRNRDAETQICKNYKNLQGLRRTISSCVFITYYFL